MACSWLHLAMHRQAVVLERRLCYMTNMNGQQQRSGDMPRITAAQKPSPDRGTAKAVAAGVTLLRQPTDPAASTCTAAAVAAAGAPLIGCSCDTRSTARRQRNTSGLSPGGGRRGSRRRRCRLPAGAMQAASSSHLHPCICYAPPMRNLSTSLAPLQSTCVCHMKAC